ncbi:MAG: hypothetical protein ACR2G3_07950 [Solirubrobacterales bacterium]
MPPRRRDDRGQASVELVAILPVLALLTLLALQLAIIGYGLWAGANAARAGARAEYVGGDERRAARSAVPEAFRRGFRATGSPLRVRVRAPSLLPGVRSVPLSARAAFDVDGPGG